MNPLFNVQSWSFQSNSFSEYSTTACFSEGNTGLLSVKNSTGGISNTEWKMTHTRATRIWALILVLVKGGKNTPTNMITSQWEPNFSILMLLTFWVGRFLTEEASLCITGYSAVSVISTRYRPVTSPSCEKPKESADIAKCFWGGVVWTDLEQKQGSPVMQKSLARWSVLGQILK